MNKFKWRLKSREVLFCCSGKLPATPSLINGFAGSGKGESYEFSD